MAGESTPGSPCIACEDRASRFHSAAGEYVYEQCIRCGLVSLRPLPDGSLMRTLYRGQGGPVDPDRDPTGEEALYIDRFSRELDRIERLRPRGSILDIGCAWGYFLSVCRSRGWTTRGSNWPSSNRNMPVVGSVWMFLPEASRRPGFLMPRLMLSRYGMSWNT